MVLSWSNTNISLGPLKISPERSEQLGGLGWLESFPGPRESYGRPALGPRGPDVLYENRSDGVVGYSEHRFDEPVL